MLAENDIPAGSVADAADLFQNAPFLERGALVDVATPGSIRWVGPTLGERTDQILERDLDISSEAITDLRNLGII